MKDHDTFVSELIFRGFFSGYWFFGMMDRIILDEYMQLIQ